MFQLLPMSLSFSPQRFASFSPRRITRVASCSLSTPTHEAKCTFRNLVTGQTASALLLMKQLLCTNYRSSNVVYSPLSIHVAMSMLAAGSQGPTKDQLLAFLGAQSTDQLNQFSSVAINNVLADGTSSGGPKLLCGNGLWVDESMQLRDSFKQILETVYNAEITSSDFEKEGEKVMKEVNQWVNNKTNGLIPALLSMPLHPLTATILVNAVYFKGTWLNKFCKSATEDRDFFLFDGRHVKVPFMTSSKKQVVCAFDGFKVLKLPYEYNEDKRCFSMCIFLPDTLGELPALVDRVCSDPGFLDRHVPYKRVRVGEFWIPRFKLTFEFEATNIMKQMGLTLPFSVGDGLAETVDPPENQWLTISDILHKAYIEVNEEGTEAAAVTGILTLCGSAPDREKPIDFVADHPFLFVIRDDMSKILVFAGQVVNP